MRVGETDLAITLAQQALMAADGLRGMNLFKDAVAGYKVALAIAEGAF